MAGNNNKRLIFILSAIALLILVSLCGITSGMDGPVYIGVLLPLTGPEGQPMYDALQLALEQINEGGGIGGRSVELILRDTRTGDLMTYAKDLAGDPRIRVVIGPYSSDALFKISNLFIRNQKVLISPTASSDEIYRAYAGTGSVWRTIANDGEITSVVIQHIKENNGKKVAILTVNNSYGKTFYDWIPYWAIENDINITDVLEYNHTDEIPDAISQLCTQDPDYLIFVHSGSWGEISSAINTLKELNSSTQLYLIYPDVDEQGFIWERADPEILLALLDSGLWKVGNASTMSTKLPDKTLMLMSKPWDPEFSSEFKTISKKDQSDFIPEAYDALLVAAEVMARFTVYPDKSPKTAAMTVLSNGSGDLLPRTKEGFQSAFNQIRAGKSPVLTGETGPLTFKSEGTDRRVPWYETYHMEEGKVIPDPVTYHNLTKSVTDSGLEHNTSDLSSSRTQDLPSGDFWAVIGAFSRDWINYRHQADALTMYQFLKERGVPDDHIILLVYDDIPNDKRNTKPGEVYHTPAEEEVRKQANPDYIGDQVNKKMLIDVLSGSGINNGAPLVQSDENSTVLVYLSSHGAPGGDLIFGDGSEHVSPEEISSITDKMSKEKKFGRMLMILESCFSGETAATVNTPRVIILTAAASDETSKAATYDSELSSWLSDEFTTELISLLRNSDPSLTLRQLYQKVYYHVRSSHPGITKGNESLDIPVYLYFGVK